MIEGGKGKGVIRGSVHCALRASVEMTAISRGGRVGGYGRCEGTAKAAAGPSASLRDDKQRAGNGKSKGKQVE